MTKKELTSTFGAHGNRLSALAAAVVFWTILVAGGAWWLLQNRLHNHRTNTIATADVRLNGVKELLAISLRQLGALPLYLSQQRPVIEFLANQQAPGAEPRNAALPRTAGTAKTGAVVVPEVLTTLDSIAEKDTQRATQRTPRLAKAPSARPASASRSARSEEEERGDIGARSDEGATLSIEDRELRIRELRRLPTMSVEEAAFVLGVSRASAFQAVDRGEIRFKQIGKRRLVLTRPLFQELDGTDG